MNELSDVYTFTSPPCCRASWCSFVSRGLDGKPPLILRPLTWPRTDLIGLGGVAALRPAGAADPTDVPTNAASAATRAATESADLVENGRCMRTSSTLRIPVPVKRKNRYTNRRDANATACRSRPCPGSALGQIGQVLDGQLAEQLGEGGEEGRLDARVGGEGERDLEVFLRPAEAVPAPLLKRPVGAAPERERLAQRGRLDAEGAAEAERLDVGAEARPEEDVVRGLCGLAGADVADADDVGGERGDGGAERVDDLGRAAAEEREPPLLGAALAAHERRVDDVDPALRAGGGELAAGAGSHRGADRDHRARPRGAQARADRLARLVVVDDDDEDEVGARRRLGGRRARRRPARCERGA